MLEEIDKMVLQTLFKPDLEALHILIAAIAAHRIKPNGYSPVWLMLIGPSGSGKTTMMNCLPAHHKLSDLTPQTFLSGYGPSKDKNSLLHRLGPDIVMIMKEFTTLLSKTTNDKNAIMGQLREIHDGDHSRGTGGGENPAWAGRLTFLACCTPAIDDHAKSYRTMGDRFMEIRWSGPDPRELARYVIDHESPTASLTEIRKKIKSYLDQCGPFPSCTEDQREALAALSEAVAIIRTPIDHGRDGKTVERVKDQESTTRIAQSLASIAMSSAALRHSPVEDQDMRLAIRLASDSCPGMLLHALHIIGKDGVSEFDKEWDLFSPFAMRRSINDLVALGLIRDWKSDIDEHRYFLTESALSLRLDLLTPQVVRRV